MDFLVVGVLKSTDILQFHSGLQPGRAIPVQQPLVDGEGREQHAEQVDEIFNGNGGCNTPFHTISHHLLDSYMRFGAFNILYTKQYSNYNVLIKK